MRIGIAFDLAPGDRPGDGPDDQYEEFDKPETVDALARVLERAGHTVIRLGDGRELLAKLLEDRVDFVWNLAEGEGVGRSREARVPAVLEMMGIPYTGSDPLTLAVALDKQIAKSLVSRAVDVPRGCTIPADASAARIASALAQFDPARGPWIVKPAFEGSSKGIRAHSLVHTMAQASALAGRLAADYRQPILVEEYITGDEVTVGIIGNGPEAAVIGTMRVRPKENDQLFIYSIEMKRDWSEQVVYEIPAQLSDDTNGRLLEAALATYEILGCRDVARIDFRVRAGVPYFLEANPLPGLAPDWSDLVILSKGMGISHADLIRRIWDTALRRVRLAGGPV